MNIGILGVGSFGEKHIQVLKNIKEFNLIGFFDPKQIRAKEIAQTGCDTVAVGCPLCSTMVSDGLAAIEHEMEVKDIAELVWEQIKANDMKIQAAKAEE